MHVFWLQAFDILQIAQLLFEFLEVAESHSSQGIRAIELTSFLLLKGQNFIPYITNTF